MLLGVDACVSLCRLILCISGVCVQTLFQRRANVTLAECVHVVCLPAPLDLRIYVTYDSFVFCFQMSFFSLYNSFSSSSSTAAAFCDG